MRTEPIRRSYKLVNVTNEPITIKHFSIQWSPITLMPNIVVEVPSAVWISNRLRWSQQIIILHDSIEAGSKYIEDDDPFIAPEDRDEIEEPVKRKPGRKATVK